MKLIHLCLPTLLLTACASIDNAAEAAKIDAAAQTYRQCLVDRMLSNQENIDMYCRSARIGLFQAVISDPRRYDKFILFNTLAENVIEMARGDVELAKDAATGKSAR